MKTIHNILFAGALLSSVGTAFAAEDTSYTKPTGTYVGTYKFEMNTTDTSAFTESGPKFNIQTSSEGVEYKKLGYTYLDGLWKWDFDNMKVTWGGSILYALEQVKTRFQPYNQSMEDLKGGIFVPKTETELYPSIESPDEITMDIIDNNDGTYLVDFGLKIHFMVAGYPFGNTTGKFKVSFDEDELKIESLDYETDGGELDGVPGGRIADVFPYVVQPSYYSVEMKKDTGEDSNDDGITDIEAEFLGLDKNILDTDGDGIDDAEEINIVYAPKDTDKDGIPDYLEVGDDTTVGYNITKIKSDIGSSFSINFLSEIPLNGAYTSFEDYNPTLEHRSDVVVVSNAGDEILKINDNGIEIRYKTLFLSLMQEIWLEGYSTPETPSFKFVFEDGIPDGFDIYFKYVTSGTDESDSGIYQQYNYYFKIPWTKVSENEVSVTLPEDTQNYITEINPFSLMHYPFILAMGEKTKAYFIDSAVEGLAYENTGYEGETGEDGSFYYGSGEVKFSVGNVKIGTISKVNEDGKIFIQDIVGVQRDNIEDETVLKIAQFLQSLDSDTTTENIEIDDISIAALEAEGIRDIQSSDFNVEEVLTAANIEIKPMEEVKEHLKNSLIANGIIEDETNSGNDNTDNSGSSGGSGGSFSWLLLSLLALTLFKRKK